MVKAAIIVLAGTEAPGTLGRVVNALETAREFDDAGDEFELIFDGAGVGWIAELENSEHPYHSIYNALREKAGVCEYCAGAFDVEEDVERQGVPYLSENDGHPSIRSLVAEGYEVITF